jgi:hypothetical protein
MAMTCLRAPLTLAGGSAGGRQVCLHRAPIDSVIPILSVGQPILAANPLSNGFSRLRAGSRHNCPPHIEASLTQPTLHRSCVVEASSALARSALGRSRVMEASTALLSREGRLCR